MLKGWFLKFLSHAIGEDPEEAKTKAMIKVMQEREVDAFERGRTQGYREGYFARLNEQYGDGIDNAPPT